MMKVTKFKVLLYLKKGSTDKRGKAPIMGTYHPQQFDGAVLLQAVVYPKLVESSFGQIGRQEP